MACTFLTVIFLGIVATMMFNMSSNLIRALGDSKTPLYFLILGCVLNIILGDETAVPVDLVTCSGSGLDPHISPAAAEYQVARIAKANDMTEDEVREIIQNCTDGRFLGIFGEETVNVLKVNLMLDGILEG